MAQWNENPSWTPFEQINGGNRFERRLSAEDLNTLAENIAYLKSIGVTGDATAKEFTVVEGFTYYANNKKHTGTMRHFRNIGYSNLYLKPVTVPNAPDGYFDIYARSGEYFYVPPTLSFENLDGEAIASIQEANLISPNIKQGVNIFGLVGSYEGGNLQQKTVTPSKNVQNVSSDSSYYGLSKVIVNAIPDEYIIPNGTKTIDVEGITDVTEFAEVDVNIPKSAKEVTITENGVYDITADNGLLTNAIVNVNVQEKLPQDALTMTGDCSYRFAYNGWNWFIDRYGSNIITNDIISARNMFYASSKLKNIPFDLDFSGAVGADLHSLFYMCTELREIPTIKNCRIEERAFIFNSCYQLRNIPQEKFENWDWTLIDNKTSNVASDSRQMFTNCYSLRELPMIMLQHGNPNSGYSYSIYNSSFSNCYTLDEITELPILTSSVTWTSNAFGSTFNSCSRLKNLTFAKNNGVPYTVNWKSQTIDLSTYVGYASLEEKITGYNSGITTAKKVYNSSTYSTLKNDNDWYSLNASYSRYNHDSAVATINSLPDTSAYLATAGGTNTIKFKGAAGASTDGGAINTLTEEEIAVATAKGWTVTLV